MRKDCDIFFEKPAIFDVKKLVSDRLKTGTFMRIEGNIVYWRANENAWILLLRGSCGGWFS